MKKRFLASLLALELLLSLVPGAAFAAGEGAVTVGTFEELKTAIDGGSTSFILSQDITLADTVAFDNLNIDLNKHSILVPEDATLDVRGGTYTSEGCELLKISGHVNIYGGEFRSTPPDSEKNGLDSKSVITVEGNGTLDLRAGTVDASATFNAPDYGMYALALFDQASAVLGQDSKTDGLTVKGSYAAIGMNNLRGGSGLNLDIYGGTYSVEHAIPSEKFNSIVYMPAQARVIIHDGAFQASGSTGTNKGPYVFSIPYRNVALELFINGGEFASSSTIFRTEAPTDASVSSGKLRAEITKGTFKETTPQGGEHSVKKYLFEGWDIGPNGELLKPRAEGLTVTTAPLDEPKENTVKVEVKAGDNAVTDRLYYNIYKIESGQPDPVFYVGADVPDGWTELKDFILPNVSDGKHVAVIQTDALGKKIEKFGISGATDDGFTPAGTNPDIEDLTVTAKRETDNKVTLTVTGDKAEGSARYYRLGETNPAKPTSDTFTDSEWEDFPTGSFKVTDNDKYVEVVEVKDSKITHWGKTSVPAKDGTATDPGVDIKNLTVTAKRETDNKVTLTVTGDKAEGSARYYRLYETAPEKPTSDGFAAGEWTALPTGSFTVTDKQKYVAVAEVKDNKITHWGKAGIPAKTDLPTDPDQPTNPVLPTDYYWISTYSNSRGSVSTSSWAYEGETVWVRLNPRSGYYADGLTVTDRLGYRLDVYHEGNDWYTFTMPASNVWLDPIFISGYVSRPTYSTYTPANNTSSVPETTYRPSYNSGTATYRDVPANAWYYSAVQYVYRYDLMSGTGSGRFSPNQTTTRAMVVTMLYNMAGRPSVSGGKFDDVDAGAWYADAVVWAAKNRITSGYGGFFRPEENVTREQMALMLYNYAKLQNCDVSAQSGLSGFSDTARIAPQAQKAVSWANAAGLLNGVSGGRLDPKGLVTRAQIASILMNFRENVA